MLLTEEDRQLLSEKQIPESQLREQLVRFSQGFPFMDIVAPATVRKGICVFTAKEREACIKTWDAYRAKDREILKFVPASGAASRMFKDLYAFLSAPRETPVTGFEKRFFDGIADFAFYDLLNGWCRGREGRDIPALLAAGRYKSVAAALLEGDGLGYGRLPKGLLLFHAADGGARTALEEQLVEGALYASNRAGEVHVHLTVSPEHLPLFERMAKEKAPLYERMFGVKYTISWSVQSPGTDTVAVDATNEPFREPGGALLFRPGGHGALIGNLDRVDADVIFVKNIDNVVPDHLKAPTVLFKKALAGLLVGLQEKIFGYLRLIESGGYTRRQVEEMIYFLQNRLCVKNPEMKYLEDAELILYIRQKLLRPLRVCGMVRNTGEPGGGPFLVRSAKDGVVSLQIVESSQIDLADPQKKAVFERSAYFNPVDLVCAPKGPDGRKYHLPDFVDGNAGFISRRSRDGRELKALELPGLWNGAMSDWNTVFVEAPPETFNPVKSVIDLLRPQHQPLAGDL
ncbi:MAG: DUF4301 family protein [Tannerella sp.]|jgi:hypothetical protein|nr:DUF4301 family protein [Tannerella sp.]